jgi:hypothetical protein
MDSSWKSETGRLTCVWSEIGRHDNNYDPPWMREAASDVLSGYLTPLPDFLCHSPFGGVAWFQPNPANQ